jgi:hypothetical protein
VLELRDVVCCYGQVMALKGGSLTVGKGQLVARLQADRRHRITSIIPSRPNVSPAHTVVGGGRLKGLRFSEVGAF